MKVTPSPLVSEMRGKTAGLVAATWKGIQYVRMHVIPQNPQTTAQTAVRDSLARCVTLWRSLHIIIKQWLDKYYDDYAMSGFNGFIKLNRVLEQAADALKPVPDSPYHPAVLNFAAAEGAGAGGDIDCTWTAGGPGKLTDVGILTRLEDTNVFETFHAPSEVTGAQVISGLTAGGTYNVHAFYLDSTALVAGTPVCIEDVTAKA